MSRKCSLDSAMTSVNQEEVIEIISVHSDDPHRSLGNETMETSTYYDLTPISDNPDRVHVLPLHPGPPAAVKEIKTKKQKLIGRVVAVVAMLMLLMSILLVGITLSMSSHIDEMVRQMNSEYIIRPTRPTRAALPDVSYATTSTVFQNTSSSDVTDVTDDVTMADYDNDRLPEGVTMPPLPVELTREKG